MKRFLLAIPALLLIAAPALAAEPGDFLSSPGFEDPYMVGNQSTRWYVDQETFKSWASPVATSVDAPQLSQWTLAGALPIREGSKLVKFGTDPQVYAVGPHGALHWISTEALASQLYGSAWNQSVVTRPPSLYANYTLSAPIVSLRHPDGTLIRYEGGDSTIYYLINGVARPFATDFALKVNDFNSSSVLTLPASFHYVRGNPVNSREQDLNPMLKSS